MGAQMLEPFYPIESEFMVKDNIKLSKTEHYTIVYFEISACLMSIISILKTYSLLACTF